VSLLSVLATRRYAAATIVCCLTASLYVVPAAFARAVSNGYQPLRAAEVPSGVTAIVVLGSGVNRAPRGRDTALDTLNQEGVARTLEAARLFELLDPAWVITSGGNVDADHSQPSGIVMRDALMTLGVPRSRIVVEATSQNTHDEAALLSPILHRLGAQHVVLVTSPIHMVRSLGAFRAEGWNAIPAIAARRPSDHPTTEAILHELIGIPYYRVLGWYR
jgi:uncharacterized SAM-binding protein YcdF (DUF218 family)